MKKLFCMLLFLVVSIFIVNSANADLLLPSVAPDYLNPTSIVSGDQFEKEWLEGLVGEPLFLLDKEEAGPEEDSLNIYNLNEPEGMVYYILKFGNDPSHWAFIDDGDGVVDELNFGETELSLPNYGLSHASYYGTAPVPEPSTILLLGLGLVGLAGLGRKKIKS